MIRVGLKTHSSLSRAALVQMLATQPDMEIVVEGPGRPAQLREDAQPDVLVVEIDPSEEFTSEESSEIVDAGTPVVLLVENPSGSWFSSALQHGAKAILPASVSTDELATAVRAVSAGLVVMHPDDVAAILPVRQRDRDVPDEALTPREQEVLTRMGEGLSNKEIAARLGISENTAKFHVASVMSKLGVASRTEAVTAAIRRGLLFI